MKLLVVDDHTLFARGVALLVEQGLGWSVRLAGSVESALPLLAEGFDAVLLDLELPGVSGLEGLARLQASAPSLPVVVCSSHSGELARAASLERGARAYLNKAEPPERLLAVLARALRGASESAEGGKVAPAADLTPRQREVLWLVAEGKSNKVIARALDMSENTVRNHVAAILDRLGVGNRHEAAAAAQRLGLR
jgi:DNA-binding NarL/FixJ family response regulator